VAGAAIGVEVAVGANFGVELGELVDGGVRTARVAPRAGPGAGAAVVALETKSALAAGTGPTADLPEPEIVRIGVGPVASVTALGFFFAGPQTAVIATMITITAATTRNQVRR